MSEFDETQEEINETARKAKAEARRLQELFVDVFTSEEGIEALAVLRNYFDVDIPSAAAAGFDAGKSFYMDGHKAVFKTIDDIIKGQFNE